MGNIMMDIINIIANIVLGACAIFFLLKIFNLFIQVIKHIIKHDRK